MQTKLPMNYGMAKKYLAINVISLESLEKINLM